MAIDPEEFKRRRQARKVQRDRQRKKLWIKLGIAGIVLIACGVGIFAFARKHKTPDTTPPTNPSATATTQAAADTTVIHLAAVGDLNVTQRVVDSADGDYDYTRTFMDVAPILANADITTVNFEGSFFGAPYGEDRSAPDTLATALSRAGVDLVQLANSYSIYKGMDGLAATVNAIYAAGMEPVGAYANPQAAKEGKGYTIQTVQGMKIAFVSFTKGMNGMALPPGNESCVNLLYTDYATDYQTVDTEGISRILSAVKRQKPDLTVALVHWGSEYNNTVSESQEKICQLLWDQGVNAVIGTHSHYVQQMSLDPETGNFVAYSLGDFVGDADRAGSEYSVVLDLEITKENKTGETKITGFSYTPIFSVTEEEKPTRVVRIREAMAAYQGDYIDKVSESTYNAMEYALERIEARIKGE